MNEKKVVFYNEKIKIRFANKKDVYPIYRIGTSTQEFAVSKGIRFYEKDEIGQWIKDRENNMIVVATTNSKIVGFACCKIMTQYWAMVDNFYVSSIFRKKGIGTRIENFLEKELKKRRIDYITRLVKPKNKASRKFLKERGFKEHNRYIWIDKTL